MNIEIATDAPLLGRERLLTKIIKWGEVRHNVTQMIEYRPFIPFGWTGDHYSIHIIVRYDDGEKKDISVAGQLSEKEKDYLLRELDKFFESDTATFLDMSRLVGIYREEMGRT